MKRVLLVGETPYSSTGNAHMMRGILNDIDTDKYEVACFGSNDVQMSGDIVFQKPAFQHIPASASEKDPLGKNKLIETIKSTSIDILMFVGIDIWAYCAIFHVIKDLQRTKGFKWIGLFPYDLRDIRADWIDWINNFDYPCVYSEYGYELIKSKVPNLRYFRPPFYLNKMYKPIENAETREELRNKYFPGLPAGSFVFGFVGVNQIRKDPLRFLRAFAEVQRLRPNAVLYLHTELDMGGGVFNMNQFIVDLGILPGSVYKKPAFVKYPPNLMVEFYNCFDCYVNCSLQEGLSWTVLEAMMCGTPFIASDNTAHSELLMKGAGVGVESKEIVHMPIIGASGNIQVEADCCTVPDMVRAMIHVMDHPDARKGLRSQGLKMAKKWIDGCSDVSELLDEVSEDRPVTFVDNRVDRVLFCQKASAGDILMTTKCFKGLKERYGLPLDYMTQKRFIDIVEGNPHIDKILPWNETDAKQYKYVLNPHAERILPGHWGRNSNSLLSDFYWKILDVEPDDFYIERKQPSFEIADAVLQADRPIVMIYTTGGSALYRTYKFMSTVCDAIKDRFLTIQAGGPDDFHGGAELTFSGKLSFREEAWIVSHAKFGITVDTFGSHLLGAFGKSLIMLPGSSNANVVKPDVVNDGNVICLSPDYMKYCEGLGPCSGAVQDCPAPCMGRVTPGEILSAFEELLMLEGRRGI